MERIDFKDFKHYILYLYIHVARADGIIQDQEKSLILKFMKKLFPNISDHESLYKEWVSNYGQSSSNAEEIIRAGNEKFSKIEFHKKYKIFIQLYDIICADGVVVDSETESINKLKKIINMNVD